MCFKILVLVTIAVAVSARKVKEDLRVQYLGSPKTDYHNDGSKSSDSFGSDLSRKFGGGVLEDRYKLSTPNFDNFGSFNHRQFQQHDKDHEFDSFGSNSRTNFGSGSTERNYRKATETGFRQKTHEERPLGFGGLDHGVGFETSDREERVRDRSIENRSHKSSSNNFRHDSSSQGSSRKYYSSGSSDFHTESLGNVEKNHRYLNSKFNQDYHENQFKSQDVEDVDSISESNKRDFEGNNQRESRKRKKDQFEIIPGANSKIIEHENISRKSNFNWTKEREEDLEISTTEETNYSNEKSYRENSNQYNRERDSRRDFGQNDRPMHSPNYDSRNPVKIDEVSREKSSSNRRQPDQQISGNNGATSQRENDYSQSSSSVVRKIKNENTNQRADENISNANSTKEEEQWIWGDGEKTTTKTPDVDDRAAFSGDKCPTGKVRLPGSSMCITVD